MFHVHTYFSHSRDIEIDPFLQRSVKLSAFLEKLANVTASYVCSQLFCQIGTVKPFADGLKTFGNACVTTHDT